MNKQRGLSRVEVVVIIVVVAFIALIVIGLGIGAAIFMPELQKPREQGKRAVCLSNLKQLQLAWILYADENEDKIVNGAAGMDRPGELPWVGKDWHDDYKSGKQLPEDQQISEIKKGALFPYCLNIKLYRCPSGIQDEMRTYSIVDSMNGTPQPGNSMGRGPSEIIDELIIKNRRQISSPGQRVVFIDVGRAILGSFAVYYDKEQWWAPPPVQHGDGMNLSFVDGHSEYWKWKDSRTIKWGLKMKSGTNYPQAIQEGNEDIRRVQKAVWGQRAGN